MPDPVYIIHSTAYEHSIYAKRQKRKQLVGSLIAIGLGCVGCSYLYYLAWGYVH